MHVHKPLKFHLRSFDMAINVRLGPIIRK